MCVCAQSVVNKTSELHDILYNFEPDCVLVSEMQMHGDIYEGILDLKSAYNILQGLFYWCPSTLELLGIDFINIIPKL